MLKWLLYSDVYMPLLALVVFLFQWRKMHKVDMLIFYYLLFNVILFAITDVMSYKSINNLYLYHFFSWAELIVIVYYILRVILKKPLIPVIYITVGYTLFEIVNLIFWEPLTVFNSNSSAISNLILAMLSMYYMLQLSKSDDILHFQRLPSFWIISAFLISCTLGAIVLAMFKFYKILNQAQESRTTWMIMVFAIMLKFILIIVGLLCYKRPQHKSIHQQPFLL